VAAGGYVDVVLAFLADEQAAIVDGRVPDAQRPPEKRLLRMLRPDAVKCAANVGMLETALEEPAHDDRFRNVEVAVEVERASLVEAGGYQASPRPLADSLIAHASQRACAPRGVNPPAPPDRS